MNETIKKNYTIFTLFISIGILLRFAVMSFGHNFDFESYCIVGDISGHFRNVYAETSRYNYGMIFSWIQGFLYRIAEIKSENFAVTYRIYIVATLTMADLGITYFIAKRHSLRKAIIFFLNPISIIITGYHNQFDNIAIVLALLMLVFYNEEDKFNKKDIGFILIFTLSLMTKHILFMLPFLLLLRKGLNWKKKIAYACIPPALFLISFMPFVIGNEVALHGIINNVFLYRSFNNAPLFSFIYSLIGFPSSPRIFVYAGMMIIVAYLTRKFDFEKQLMFYLIAMVAFSSAIANQYLAIPLVALCVLDVDISRYAYMIMVGTYLVLEVNGLGVLGEIQATCPAFMVKLSNGIVSYGYIIAAWILFLTLIYELYLSHRKEKYNTFRIKFFDTISKDK